MRFVVFLLSVAAATAAFGAELADGHKDPQKNMQQIAALTAAVQSACSCTIDGIAIDNPSSRVNWRIDFHGSKGWGDPGDATPAQVAAANAALKSFVFLAQ